MTPGIVVSKQSLMDAVVARCVVTESSLLEAIGLLALLLRSYVLLRLLGLRCLSFEHVKTRSGVPLNP